MRRSFRPFWVNARTPYRRPRCELGHKLSDPITMHTGEGVSVIRICSECDLREVLTSAVTRLTLASRDGVSC